MGAGAAGRAGVRGGGVRGRALSSAGHRRQSGTCREVKRRRFTSMLNPGSRRLTSRQNPDRASPARPRREHTPRRLVWAAPGPGPVARSLHDLAWSRILHRRSGPLFSTTSTLGSMREFPRISRFFFFRKGCGRVFRRWRRLEWKRIGDIETCDGEGLWTGSWLAAMLDLTGAAPARSRRETPGCAWHGISTPVTANDDAGIPLSVRPGHGIPRQNQESKRWKIVHRGFENRGR